MVQKYLASSSSARPFVTPGSVIAELNRILYREILEKVSFGIFKIISVSKEEKELST